MNDTGQKMRVGIYARFSDEMQSNRSAEDQERECRAYAERMGWGVTLTERDEAVRAGASAGREGYQRLLLAAEQKVFDLVLFEEVSRFSRDFFDGFADVARLKKLGVKIADTKYGVFDPTSMDGQLKLSIALASSQQETQRLGERSKRGIKGKCKRRLRAPPVRRLVCPRGYQPVAAGEACAGFVAS